MSSNEPQNDLKVIIEVYGPYNSYQQTFPICKLVP